MRSGCTQASVKRRGEIRLLEILGKAAIAAEPGEGSFNYPALRQHDEALYVVAPLDDLEPQREILATAASPRWMVYPVHIMTRKSFGLMMR